MNQGPSGIIKTKIMKHTISYWQYALLILPLGALGIFLPLWLEGAASAHLPLIVVTYLCGIPLILQILLKMIKGDLGADSLAALAIFTAGYMDQYLAATLIILMLASGQVLEAYAMRRASSVLSALAKRVPAIAHKKADHKLEDIPLNRIRVKDYLVILPHETCPVDGVVIEGHGAMDESYLTGEPYLVVKAPGAKVISGSINGEEMLIIEVLKRPEDSRYAKIMKVMEESEQRRPKFRRLGDQLGAIFAPLALIVALLAWYGSGEAMRFLAVLVIATPCPLLIAIPITIISAISLAARKSIIIKDPVVLERLPTCRTAIFDKTGTLTYGQAELTDIITTPGFDKDAVLGYAACLEQYSKHPLASAILTAAKAAHLKCLKVEWVRESPGEGLLGAIKGKEIHIVGRSTARRFASKDMASLPPKTHGMECFVFVDQKLAALFQFRDTIRKEGQSFIRHLRPIHHFKRLMIVSGDQAPEVQDIADQLGIKTIYAAQSPEQKVEIVRKETALAPTLFMGDGINDAPALTAATVGIAFGHENVIATEAAGAVILESSLTKLDELIHLSGLMRRVALTSAVGGMLLSVIGMGFAAFGYIPPVMGALLQEGIDVIAILYALQITWYAKIKGDV